MWISCRFRSSLFCCAHYVLKGLGIKPNSFREFILVNGEVIKKPIGNTYFEYQGKVRGAAVVFGEKGVFLLGATTIEAFGWSSTLFDENLSLFPWFWCNKTPGVVTLDITRTMYLLRFEKEGYEPLEFKVKRTLSGWLFGDIIFWGIIC